MAAPKPAAAAPPANPPAAGGTAAPMALSPAAGGGAGLKPWLPVLAALVLAPVCTWAVGEFVLIPRLQKKLAAPPAADTAASHGEASADKDGKGGKEGAPNYEFQNVVVNLAGTMGTRYLKTSFLVTGAPEANIKSVFETNKPRLTDVTLNVLSSLSLADLEEPGAKNVLRDKLVTAYNQTLGRKVAEQVYFSDFVVQ